jgi:hypothetical protein
MLRFWFHLQANHILAGFMCLVATRTARQMSITATARASEHRSNLLEKPRRNHVQHRRDFEPAVAARVVGDTAAVKPTAALAAGNSVRNVATRQHIGAFSKMHLGREKTEGEYLGQ